MERVWQNLKTTKTRPKPTGTGKENSNEEAHFRAAKIHSSGWGIYPQDNY